jgi:hypothetical protein
MKEISHHIDRYVLNHCSVKHHWPVDFIGILKIFMACKGQKNFENNADEPMPTTSKKQCTILQYVKGQDLE